MLHRISTPEFLRVFPTVIKGAPTRATRGRGRLRVADGAARGRRGIVSYADGERFAPLPLMLEAVPGALTVLA
jgi:diacylglycerol kinase (ATP)